MNWLRRLFSPRESQPIEHNPEDYRPPDYWLSKARIAALAEADALVKARNYVAALDLHLRIVAYDGLGQMTLNDMEWRWDQRFAQQAHGILKSIAKSANYLRLSRSDLEARYFMEANGVLASAADLTPPYTADEIWAKAWPDIAEHIETGTRWRPRKAP